MSKTYNKIVLALGKLIMAVHLVRRFNPWRRKVVLIDKSDGLGDVLLFLPYLQVIRNHFPMEKYIITILARPQTAEIFTLQKCADKIVAIPPYRNKLQWLFFRLIFWIKTPCDVLIMTWGQRDLLDPYRSQSKIAFTYHNSADDPCNRFLTRKRLIYIDGLTIYERFQNYLERADIKEKPEPYDYRFLIHMPPELSIRQKYIVVCPGASTPIRQWPASKFCDLLDLLQQHFSQKIVLVGTVQEKEQCDYICVHAKNGSSFINLCGQTVLRTLFGIINNADFIISNDTGTAHIGAVLKKKVFVIAGGGDYRAFFPYPAGIEGKYVFSIFRNGDHSCFPCSWQMPCCGNNKKKTAPCISDISVKQVFNTVIANWKTND